MTHVMLGPFTIYSPLTFSCFGFSEPIRSPFFEPFPQLESARGDHHDGHLIALFFTMSFFTHFSDTASRLGLRATSAVLCFSHILYRRIHFSELVMMLEIISRSHLVQLQHCIPTPCHINLCATSAVVGLFHSFYMSHPLLSYCKCFVILPPFIHPARRPTSVPPHPQSWSS